MTTTERHDVTEVLERLGYVTTPCRKCRQPVILKFYGGELDVGWCCGVEYALEHGRIDLVVSR